MNLLEIREKRNLSQNEVSAAVGISQQCYSRYERGEREADYTTLCKLADYFDVTVDELLGHSESHLFEDARIAKPEILELFDSLSPIQQENLLNYARGMAVSNQLDKKEQINKKRA